MQGPNVKKLIVHRMSSLMIPPGCKDELATGLRALLKEGNIGKVCKEATAWVMQAIAVVRTAAEPNEWKNASDEAIAGKILEGIEKKLRRNK